MTSKFTTWHGRETVPQPVGAMPQHSCAVPQHYSCAVPQPLGALPRRSLTYVRLFLGLLCCAPSVGCSDYLDRLDMHEQPRYETYEESEFFDDGLSARPTVEGTVARGQLHADEAYHTGKFAGKFVDQLPVELTAALVERGRQRYNIYCSPCHAQSGDGGGMIVQRGFRRPPSFHIERLRSAPPGHFFDVITAGFGAMPSYNKQIEPGDRWAIVAYVRALQLSQHAVVEDLPPDDQDALQRSAGTGEQP